VQVDPIKPTLKAPGIQPLKLKYVKLLSNVAFKFNLRRFIMADAQGREVRRLQSSTALAAARWQVNAWRATRDVLREKLVEAETQHLEWERKCKEIKNK
jgi:hypothetical protein